MRLRKLLKRLLWIAAGLCLVYFFVTSFLYQVRYVDSGSMEPTIYGSEANGEYVLVELGRFVPERFDLVVLRRPDGSLIGKRVFGLPTERVQIRHGDVLIDGEHLAADVPRPEPIVVFDDRWHRIEDHFVVEDTPWRRDGDEWLVDAAHIRPGDSGGLMRMHKLVTDSYLDRDHRIIHGTRVVNDVIVRATFRFEAVVEGSLFRIGIFEWGDRFEARFAPLDDATARLSIVRRNYEDNDALLVSRDVPFDLEDTCELEFENVDNHLVLKLHARGEPVARLGADYRANVFHASDHFQEGKTFDRHVDLAVESANLRLSGLRVARDLFITHRDQYGVEDPVELSPNEIFVLGDNSASSRDGREFGPSELRSIFGKAVRVVWPFSSSRPLRGASEGL